MSWCVRSLLPGVIVRFAPIAVIWRFRLTPSKRTFLNALMGRGGRSSDIHSRVCPKGRSAPVIRCSNRERRTIASYLAGPIDIPRELQNAFHNRELCGICAWHDAFTATRTMPSSVYRGSMNWTFGPNLSASSSTYLRISVAPRKTPSAASTQISIFSGGIAFMILASVRWSFVMT